MKFLAEQQIWEYLDGRGSSEEREKLEKLIETEPNYKSAFEVLSQINESLMKMETDEPSLSFTRNLMERLKTEPISGSIKSMVDKRIINGLVLFFLSSIATLFGILLFQLNWKEVESEPHFMMKILHINPSAYLNGWTLHSFLFADLLIGLYVLDLLFKRKIKKRGNLF